MTHKVRPSVISVIFLRFLCFLCFKRSFKFLCHVFCVLWNPCAHPLSTPKFFLLKLKPALFLSMSKSHRWILAIFWMLRGNIIRTVPCCVLCKSCAQRHAHKMYSVLKSICRLFRVSFCVFFFRFSSHIVCFCDSLVAVVVVFKFAVVGCRFLQYRAKRLAGKKCPCWTWFSCSYFYSMHGLVWSDLVVDLIDAHSLRQCDDFICACSSGFFLRNNHNCTEFLASPSSTFPFLLPLGVWLSAVSGVRGRAPCRQVYFM